MINKALSFIINELNEYISLKTGLETPVKLMTLGGRDSKNALGKEDVGCSLVNIEEERNVRNRPPYSEPVNGTISKRNPEVMLHLFLLFAVNPEDQNYLDGMKMLSFVIAFFQGRSEFNKTNSPSLDKSLSSIHMDLHSLPLEQSNYLWGSLGTHYLPSILYRMRLVSIMDDKMLGSGPGIDKIKTISSLQDS